MIKEKQNIDQVIKAIIELAVNLDKKQEKYSRADVAYELKDKGIKHDSFFVEELIYSAYKASQSEEVKNAIKKVFYNNQLTKVLIDDNNIKNIIQNESYNKAILQLEIKAENVNKILENFEKDLGQLIIQAQNFAVDKKLMSKISGTHQIDKVKTEAESVFKAYEQIISSYREAKQSTSELIEDYTLIRHEVLKIYRENIIRLTDIFGESIKSVEPTLFNYNSIEWLDTDSMLENTQLEFDKIMHSCSKVIAIINKNFIKGLSKATNALGKNNDKKLGLILAGLEIVNSWTESANKATEIRQDLEKLKHKMDYDVTTIKGDIFRLRAIDKTLKDINIPATDTFRQYSKDVFNFEIVDLIDNLYSHENIRELKIKKDEFLSEYNSLELEIIDHQNQISNYSERIKINESQLKEYRPLYLKAQNLKPSKPFFLFNLLSFGKLKSNYNRDVSEWHQEYSTVIEAFNIMQEDVNIDKKELDSHKKSMKTKKVNIKVLQEKIDKQSQLINSQIQSNPKIQQELAKHLVPVINLLRMARKILELKIDEKKINTVKINEVKIDAFPSELKKNISEYISKLRKESSEKVSEINIYDESEVKKEEEEHLESHEPNDVAMNSDKISVAKKNENNKLVQETTNSIIDNAFDLIENTIKLKELKVNGNLAHQEYANELEEIKIKFNDSILKDEERGIVLREVIKKVNSGNGIEIRNALLELLKENDDDWIKETELINKLKNNEDIII